MCVLGWLCQWGHATLIAAIRRLITYPILAIISSIIIIMADTNINSAPSPVTLNHPPKIRDQYLVLSILDRVVNETLRVKIPFLLHCMYQLVGAMVSVIVSHLYLLVSVKEHPNSHGIIAESDANDVTWMWPNLLPCDIKLSTPKRGGTHLHMHPLRAIYLAYL